MRIIAKSVQLLILGVTFALVFYQVGFAQDSVEEKMAFIDGNYPNKTKVARYTYLLKTLEKKTGDSKARIADMTVKSQEILRKEYGRDLTLLDLLEGVNNIIATGPKIPYANAIAAYITVIGR